MSEHTKPVLVRMTPEMHETIKAVAKAEDRSMAAQIRVAIDEYIERRAPKDTGRLR